MNGLPYYKAYPRDFIEGTIGMPLELKGAYRVLLDLIYMQAGALPDDPKYISGLLGCSVRAWSGYRTRLIEAGKISAENGIISNFRASLEVDKLKLIQAKQRENASIPKRNNGLPIATAEPRLSHTEPEPDNKEEVSYDTFQDSAAPPIDETARAVSAFNATAARLGWPSVQKLTPARRTAIKARITDCGGATGWECALAKAEASSFLCGSTGWLPNFDWITKQANFTKLMEGNYDNRTNSPAQSSAGHAGSRGPHNSMVAGFAEVAARGRSFSQ